MALPFKTAFVTGANGFIGAALTLRLAAEGVAVRALCRDSAKGAFLIGAQVVQGDIQDADQMVALTQGCEVVFHVAAVGSGSLAVQRRINVTGAENVACAAIAAQADRLIHVSTVAVYGMHQRGIVTETVPANPSRRDFYQQTKATGEQSVCRIVTEAKLPTAVIRPAQVYGPRSVIWTGAMVDLCRRLRAIPSPPGFIHPIYVDDLVDLLIAAASHPDATGNGCEVYHGAAEPVRWGDYLAAYAALAGIYRRVPISRSVMSGLTPLAWLIEQMLALRSETQDLRGGLDYLSSDAVYRIDKARDRLGWFPRTTLQQGVDRSAAWLAGRSAI